MHIDLSVIMTTGDAQAFKCVANMWSLWCLDFMQAPRLSIKVTNGGYLNLNFIFV